MQYYELYEGLSRVLETEEPEWDNRYDVIIAGGGNSGIYKSNYPCAC